MDKCIASVLTASKHQQWKCHACGNLGKCACWLTFLEVHRTKTVMRFNYKVVYLKLIKIKTHCTFSSHAFTMLYPPDRRQDSQEQLVSKAWCAGVECVCIHLNVLALKPTLILTSCVCALKVRKWYFKVNNMDLQEMSVCLKTHHTELAQTHVSLISSLHGRLFEKDSKKNGM